MMPRDVVASVGKKVYCKHRLPVFCMSLLIPCLSDTTVAVMSNRGNTLTSQANVYIKI